MDADSRPRMPLDRLAIAFSGVCAVHCVLVVLAVGTIPLWGLAWITSPHFHEWFLAAIFLPSVLAIWWGFRNHADHRIIIGGAGAFALMVLAILLRESQIIGETLESTITLSGAGTLALTHWYNLRLRRCPGAGDSATDSSSG